MISHNALENLLQEYPLLRQMAAGEPVCWTNPKLRPFAEAATDNPFGLEDALDAMTRLERFAPYIAQVFPETAERGGVLVLLPALQAAVDAFDPVGEMRDRVVVEGQVQQFDERADHRHHQR